ncbi:MULTISPECIES: hypothetical protein [unclassified Myroides]|uniref:hypothetical protein n=1 Tax=unclassified Myroides TaxID=2642485 RepID=UPI0025751FE8|nr:MULTISPECIES: hypothetical protein [unclassified Myroides]
MFGKIKFIAVCAVIALGFSSCSSDDGNPVLKLDKKKYDVLVEITDDVEIGQITAFYYDGVHVQEEQFIEDSIPVAVPENGELPEFIKTTQWTRSYNLTVAEHVSIEAYGKGESTSSQLTITVKDKDGIIIKEKIAKGKDIYAEVKL